MSITVITQSRPVTAPSRYHHGSHRDLLIRPDGIPQNGASVDAIVVPTARHTASLETAINLAARLRCTLVTLCSKSSSAYHAAKRARHVGVNLIAIDTTELPTGLIPTFATSLRLVGTPFERPHDTSLKRNLGLLFAHLIGWRRIVFLDDDITVPDPGHLRDAAALLDLYDGVGLSIGGFPDNSVVCHAYRDAGGWQKTFVGGGALAVGSASMTSFFPNIYNEDWFFLLNDVRLRPTAFTGLVKQRPYDPFANERRARAEEFGDTLAEGVFGLLDNKRRVRDADFDYWLDFLRGRRRFIGDVIDMVACTDIDTLTKNRMTTALKAARGRSLLITPELCVEYLRAWRVDRARWRRHVKELQQSFAQKRSSGDPEPEKVLVDLGLMGCSYHVTSGKEEPRGRATALGRRQAS